MFPTLNETVEEEKIVKIDFHILQRQVFLALSYTASALQASQVQCVCGAPAGRLIMLITSNQRNLDSVSGRQVFLRFPGKIPPSNYGAFKRLKLSPRLLGAP